MGYDHRKRGHQRSWGLLTGSGGLQLQFVQSAAARTEDCPGLLLHGLAGRAVRLTSVVGKGGEVRAPTQGRHNLGPDRDKCLAEGLGFRSLAGLCDWRGSLAAWMQGRDWGSHIGWWCCPCPPQSWAQPGPSTGVGWGGSEPESPLPCGGLTATLHSARPLRSLCRLHIRSLLVLLQFTVILFISPGWLRTMAALNVLALVWFRVAAHPLTQQQEGWVMGSGGVPGGGGEHGRDQRRRELLKPHS